MPDEYRVVFSRAAIDGYRKKQKDAHRWPRLGAGLAVLGVLLIILFLFGAGCVRQKQIVEAEKIQLEAGDVITVQSTLFGIGMNTPVRFVSSTHAHMRLSFEVFLRLKIEGQAHVASDMQDSLTEKVLKMVKEDEVRPDLVKIEPRFVTYPIRINDEPVFVQAIKAKGSRQELTILNNPKNPLILERARNPFHRANLLADGDWKQNILGYQVTDLMVSGYK